MLLFFVVYSLPLQKSLKSRGGKYRLSSQSMNFEKGSHRKVLRNASFYELCDQNDIEICRTVALRKKFSGELQFCNYVKLSEFKLAKRSSVINKKELDYLRKTFVQAGKLSSVSIV